MDEVEVDDAGKTKGKVSLTNGHTYMNGTIEEEDDSKEVDQVNGKVDIDGQDSGINHSDSSIDHLEVCPGDYSVPNIADREEDDEVPESPHSPGPPPLHPTGFYSAPPSMLSSLYEERHSEPSSMLASMYENGDSSSYLSGPHSIKFEDMDSQGESIASSYFDKDKDSSGMSEGTSSGPTSLPSLKEERCSTLPRPTGRRETKCSSSNGTVAVKQATKSKTNPNIIRNSRYASQEGNAKSKQLTPRKDSANLMTTSWSASVTPCFEASTHPRMKTSSSVRSRLGDMNGNKSATLPRAKQRSKSTDARVKESSPACDAKVPRNTCDRAAHRAEMSQKERAQLGPRDGKPRSHSSTRMALSRSSSLGRRDDLERRKNVRNVPGGNKPPVPKATKDLRFTRTRDTSSESNRSSTHSEGTREGSYGRAGSVGRTNKEKGPLGSVRNTGKHIRSAPTSRVTSPGLSGRRSNFRREHTRIYMETCTQTMLTAADITDITNFMRGKAKDTSKKDDHSYSKQPGSYVCALEASGNFKNTSEVEVQADIGPNANLVGQLKRLSEEHVKLQADYARLRNSMFDLSGLRSELANAYKNLEAERKERTEVENELSTTSQTVRDVLSSMEGVERELDNRGSSLIVLEDQLKLARKTIRELHDELSRSQKTISTLTLDLDKSVAAQKTLLHQVQEGEAESRELQDFLQNEKIALLDELMSLKMELNDKNKRLNSKDQECERLREESGRLREELGINKEHGQELVEQGAALSSCSVALVQLRSRVQAITNGLVHTHQLRVGAENELMNGGTNGTMKSIDGKSPSMPNLSNGLAAIDEVDLDNGVETSVDGDDDDESADSSAAGKLTLFDQVKAINEEITRLSGSLKLLNTTSSSRATKRDIKGKRIVEDGHQDDIHCPESLRVLIKTLQNSPTVMESLPDLKRAWGSVAADPTLKTLLGTPQCNGTTDL